MGIVTPKRKLTKVTKIAIGRSRCLHLVRDGLKIS